MNATPFSRYLDLLALLTEHEGLSIEELAQRTQLNPRSIYRYIEQFRNEGFTILKEGSRYVVDPQ